MKYILLLVLVLFLFSCEEKISSENETKNFESGQTISILQGDTAKINLGSFGDEEGAWIFQAPKNAQYSHLFRDLPISTIYYQYASMVPFTGHDTVGIVLNRGSDGASPGVNDSILICFIVE